MQSDDKLFAWAAAWAAYLAVKRAADDATQADGEPRHDVLAGAWRDYQATLAKLRIVPTLSGLKAA